LKRNFDLLIQETEAQSVIVNLQLMWNPRELALVRRIIQASALAVPIPATFLNDVKLAVTEACTNVIKHAFKYDPNKKFDIRIQISKKLIMVKIIYEDRNFEPEKIPNPDFSKIQEGGLGVFIMRNIMDDFVYSKNPENGEIVLRMVKIFDFPND